MELMKSPHSYLYGSPVTSWLQVVYDEVSVVAGVVRIHPLVLFLAHVFLENRPLREQFVTEDAPQPAQRTRMRHNR